MSVPWEDLAQSILGTIRERAKDFLSQNDQAKQLVEERAVELAKLLVEYGAETDEVVRKDILNEIAIVRQTIENELSAVALNGKTESIATFKEIVGSVFSTVVKVLPVIFKMI